MNYEKIYNDLLSVHGVTKDKPKGYETHHILPRSLGGSDSESNLIHVSTRVHYLCHWLLAKSTNSPQMIHAFHMMSTGRRYNSRGYATSKAMKSKLMKEDNPMYSDESRKKQGLAMIKQIHKVRPKGLDTSMNRSDTLFGNERSAVRNYKVTSPDGEIFLIGNMRKFCRENSLNQTCMIRVCKEKLDNHFGWIACYV